jgi:hypothetical protein
VKKVDPNIGWLAPASVTVDEIVSRTHQEI